jgi:hypothetical protein
LLLAVNLAVLLLAVNLRAIVRRSVSSVIRHGVWCACCRGLLSQSEAGPATRLKRSSCSGSGARS